MEKLFDRFEWLERRLSSICIDLKGEEFVLYTKELGEEIEVVVRENLEKGTSDDQKRILKEICILFFTYNIDVYVRLYEDYQKIYEEHRYQDYTLVPYEKITLVTKDKNKIEIIEEHYLLGQKIYSGKGDFIYGMVYNHSVINDKGGFEGELILYKLKQFNVT